MKKRRIQNVESQEGDNPFSASTGDLMAGLLFIFILLLSYALLQVKEKSENDEKVVRNYNAIKTQLYIDLNKEFDKDLLIWNAEIDSINLSVRFQEPSTLFDYDSSVLKQKFKDILDDFFPRYIQILTKPSYKKNIEEIRIEGHTDSKGSYIYNMRLSQDRTRSVLDYCMLLPSSKGMQDWIISMVTANGLSSSKPIIVNHEPNDELSRRVEFRIRTNAESQIDEIMRNRREN